MSTEPTTESIFPSQPGDKFGDVVGERWTRIVSSSCNRLWRAGTAAAHQKPVIPVKPLRNLNESFTQQPCTWCRSCVSPASRQARRLVDNFTPRGWGSYAQAAIGLDEIRAQSSSRTVTDHQATRRWSSGVSGSFARPTGQGLDAVEFTRGCLRTRTRDPPHVWRRAVLHERLGGLYR